MSPAALVVVLTLAQGAVAPKPSPSPAPPPPPQAAPYEGQLLRLAELMGALSYLRDLCQEGGGAGDGARYRDALARLIASDPRPQEARDQLAGAFNRGLDGYRLTYRACTDNARAAMGAYREETARLAKEVAGRWGG